MLKYSVISNSSQIPLGPKWKDSPKFQSKDRVVVAQGGRAYQIISKKERGLTCTERTARRLLGVLTVICSLGVALIARSVRDLFVKRTMSKRFAIAYLSNKGRLILETGAIYDGDILNGKPHGKGKKASADGAVYEGDFANGLCSGKGKLTLSYCVYEGDFVADTPDGKGKVTYNDGRVYEGDISKGSLTGKGKFTYAGGEEEEGDFFRGQFMRY